MGVTPPRSIRAWWTRYRTWLIVLLVAYVLFLLVLILLSGGLRSEPFRYQLF